MRNIVFVAVAIALALPLMQAEAKEPRVPTGRPPAGNVMVALLGSGVDYRHDRLHKRLARDGEGDLIAWDFADNDNRPFATGPGTADAVLLADNAPAAPLVVVKEKPGDPKALGHMISFALRTPARIIVWPDADPSRPDWPILAEAVGRFRDRLFVVPGPSRRMLPTAENLLVVSGEPAAKALPRPDLPDVEIAWFMPPAKALSGWTVRAPNAASRDAALLIAALAARYAVRNRSLKVADIKRAILGIKSQVPGRAGVLSQFDVTNAARLPF